MNPVAWIFISLLLIMIVAFEAYLIHGIVRSIKKKPVSHSPSERKWACVRAELVSEEDVTYVNIKPYHVVNKRLYTVKSLLSIFFMIIFSVNFSKILQKNFAKNRFKNIFYVYFYYKFEVKK